MSKRHPWPQTKWHIILTSGSPPTPVPCIPEPFVTDIQESPRHLPYAASPTGWVFAEWVSGTWVEIWLREFREDNTCEKLTSSHLRLISHLWVLNAIPPLNPIQCNRFKMFIIERVLLLAINFLTLTLEAHSVSSKYFSLLSISCPSWFFNFEFLISLISVEEVSRGCWGCLLENTKMIRLVKADLQASS